jgi:hypothetical protein
LVERTNLTRVERKLFEFGTSTNIMRHSSLMSKIFPKIVIGSSSNYPKKQIERRILKS